MAVPGKVYIASMNMRGVWANPIDSNSIKVNVTSSQAKTSKNRRDFSPMTEIEGGYKGYWNFESYWQSGKVFESIPKETTKKWWKNVKEAKRRYPNSKGKTVLYAEWEEYPHEQMDYVTSRKKIYVPEYYHLVKNREMTQYYKEQVKQGKNITIYDYDGIRTLDGTPMCAEVTRELLHEKIHDTRFPFGHGYVVASLFADIDVQEYI